MSFGEKRTPFAHRRASGPRAALRRRGLRLVLFALYGLQGITRTGAETIAPTRSRTPGEVYSSVGEFSTLSPSNEGTRYGTYHFMPGTPGGRPSLSGWKAFSQQKATEARGGDIKLGPAIVEISIGSQFQYDTNINSSGTDPIADFSVSPRFTIGIDWPITRQNELDLNIGLEYRRYILHPEYSDNGLVIDPGTVLQYRVYTGDFIFTIYDTPAVITDPGDPSAIVNTVNFQQLNNAAGVSVLQDLNKLINTLGFERQDTRTLSGSFSSGDGVAYVLYGSSIYTLTPTTSLGLRGSLSRNTYSENTLNNYTTALGGVVFSSRLSEYTSYYFECGLQSADFDNNGRETSQLEFSQENGFNQNVEGTLGGGDYVQPYFLFQITSRLNKHYWHSLSLERMASGSEVSNYREINAIGYNSAWEINRLTWLQFSTQYQFGKYSGSNSSLKYAYWTSSVGLNFGLARNMELDIFYNYIVNRLSENNGSFNRQQIGVSINWIF